MPTQRALTGTVRGAQRCGRCGHARSRHLDGGTTTCSGVHYPIPGADGVPWPPTVQRCLCPNFTEPETTGETR